MMDAPLKTRHRDILNAIVRAYIETGEPVGSRTLSEHRTNSLSPASIRNVMAELAEEGFLSQPHTSAGRVPTEKAFQFYVRSLTAGRLPHTESDRVRSELESVHTVTARVERSSHILTELSRAVGIAAAIPALAQELDQVELIPLAGNRVLMILVTRDRMVRNRVVALDEPIGPDELARIRNYVNHNFGGWQLGAARRELLRRMMEERALYDAMMGNLALLFRKGMLEADTSPEIHLEGAANLLGLDVHLTRETMCQLLRALDEKKRLIELLDRFLEAQPGELEVHIGLSDIHPAMRDLALIGITVRMPSGMPAKIAVLGHMRMQYERIMGAVLQTSRALESVQF
jgi:heat-inducible transcriptional repressor